MPLTEPDPTLALWERFTQEGTLPPTLAPPLAASWQRCALRLDPLGPPRLTTLRPTALTQRQSSHFDLIAIARPVMEDIWQWIEHTPFVLMLADRSHCLLDLVGDAAMAQQLAALGLRPGAYWNEGQGGTNALELASREAAPFIVNGAEHFLRAFHPFAGAATALYSPEGRPLGSLALVGPCGAIHPHTLALVMAGARAIMNQLQTDLYMDEANRRLTELNSLFSAISEGVIAWDTEERVMHLNATARELLGGLPRSVQGGPLADLLPLPGELRALALRGEALHEAEMVVPVGGTPRPFMATLQPIQDGRRQPLGTILTLRPLEQVRRLVHRMAGADAPIRLADLPGESIPMQRLRRLARVAARGRAPILLRGPSGVEVEALAQAIHNESSRAEGPFVTVNVGSIPPELMVREFLGEGNRAGKFELADGGTLLLVGVESMTFESRLALLSVIERGEVQRLGASQAVAVSVRLMATTSADLEQLVEEGNFPRALYFHLRIFLIEVPPLHERPEDIPAIAERLLARLGAQGARDEPLALRAEAVACLQRYPWPGNLRELNSVLERAAVGAEEGAIGVEQLPAPVREGWVVTPGRRLPQPVLSMLDAEREAILRASVACDGHRGQMAARLGIGRTTLWRRMKALGISAAALAGSERP